jgi:hypothetical protein
VPGYCSKHGCRSWRCGVDVSLKGGIAKIPIKQPEKKERRLISIDETKLKLENKQIFVWTATDVDTKECLSIWASEGRGSFEACFP